MENKTETLEESFSKYCNDRYFFPIRDSSPDLESAKFGAKWQAERMYSEEDVRKAIRIYSNSENDLSIGEILQKLKNK